MDVHKTVYTIEVYHDEPIPPWMDLEDLVFEFTSGSWYADVSTSNPVLVPEDQVPEFFSMRDAEDD